MTSPKAAAGTAVLLLLLLLLTSTIAAPEASKTIALDSMPLAPAAEDAASTTCVGSLLALSPCLPFFRDADGGTDASSAPEGCCEGLRGIVADQEVCLCHVVNHTLERAIGVDIPANRAFALIGSLCGITLPEDFLVTCASRNNVPPLYACPAPSA
ncbi:non-specific lipid-transfer protein C6 [Brachypodium distachyon]|uniref:Bifunctional inhibitor/plant lipid transfer protein/seed storage helical domain-containing protein n=1 Tax=Brachypodium distachyon TaxID=15368 RepID=I1IKV5_BRADI|nr:non-specific lipid-transfer protein C6 [Brachypodium distachyon]PNT63409.1 hypothetical protein BRADI_4g15300v3 [Brachypodium distachyon]|eukprot:XP_003575928.2 non-specific lipid-transfer protein C6 [Brachypodium distachyon]